MKREFIGKGDTASILLSMALLSFPIYLLGGREEVLKTWVILLVALAVIQLIQRAIVVILGQT